MIGKFKAIGICSSCSKVNNARAERIAWKKERFKKPAIGWREENLPVSKKAFNLIIESMNGEASPDEWSSIGSEYSNLTESFKKEDIEKLDADTIMDLYEYMEDNDLLCEREEKGFIVKSIYRNLEHGYNHTVEHFLGNIEVKDGIDLEIDEIKGLISSPATFGDPDASSPYVGSTVFGASWRYENLQDTNLMNIFYRKSID